MSVVRQLPNGKAKLRFACTAAMPQQVSIDHAVAKIEAQAGHENVIELFPEERSIRFIVFS